MSSPEGRHSTRLADESGRQLRAERVTVGSDLKRGASASVRLSLRRRTAPTLHPRTFRSATLTGPLQPASFAAVRAGAGRVPVGTCRDRAVRMWPAVGGTNGPDSRELARPSERRAQTPSCELEIARHQAGLQFVTRDLIMRRLYGRWNRRLRRSHPQAAYQG